MGGAMGSSPAAQEANFQSLRQRIIKQFAVQHRLNLRIPPRHGIADDNKVRIVRNIFRPETVADRNPLALEESGHRRIHIVIRTRHFHPAIAQRRRQRAQGRAADAGEVDFVQGGGFHGAHQ